jgi:hypothetical protein
MADAAENVAEVPLNFTAVTVLESSNAKPAIVTEVSGAPLNGGARRATKR